MKRQEYNYKILEFLRKEFPENDEIYDSFEEYIEHFPAQRFGQIFCNYICPDYRNMQVTEYTAILLNKWFKINFDPFFEESSETYKRLCLKKEK